MKKIQSKIVLLTVFLLTFVVIFNTQALAATKKASIINIPNISVDVKQNEKYKLPKTVAATMSDKIKKSINIIWNKQVVDTAKTGSTTYLGSVTGYKKKVKLSVNVFAYITNIADIEVTIKQNQEFALPTKATAEMSDGASKELSVSWDNKIVDTSKIGSTIYLGSVTGYKKKVNLSVDVFSYITNIADIEITIKQNQKLDLPADVTAEISDGTTKKLSVSWDSKETKAPGTYNLDGTVEGYEKKTHLKLIVEKLTLQDIAKESKKIVMINEYNSDNDLISKGSGIIISKDGKVVTNYHVIDYADHLEAVTSDNQTYNIAYVVDYDVNRDMAILKIDSKNEFEAVNIGDSDKLELGQEVVAIGSPLGLQNTVSNGLISSIRTSNRVKDAKDIQTSTPISPGSSGGALFNMAGEVIGITYAGMENGQNLNFAIPINEVAMLKKESNLPVKKVYENEHVIDYGTARYEGTIENGSPNGYGYMKWSDGSTYYGDWVNGKQHGKGSKTWQNGDIYTGDWVNGVRSGYGTYIWGIGTTWAGDIFEGKYQNNLRSGFGIYIYANGRILSGTWDDTKLVTKTTEIQNGTWELLYFSGVQSVPGILFNDCYFSTSGKYVYYVYPKFDESSYVKFLEDDGFKRLEDYTDSNGVKVISMTKNNYELSIVIKSTKVALVGEIQ